MKNPIDIIENPVREIWEGLITRPEVQKQDLSAVINDIFEQVRTEGDIALKRTTQIFDKVEVPEIRVTEKEIKQASESISQDLKQAIRLAKANIEKFHASQKSEPGKLETSAGVWCWQEKRPIEKVGLYIPGGTAPLFSTVLMLAIPAQLANCKEIVLCTPPGKEGSIHPAILYTADLCGISKIFKVGGIQAIAGLTFGTESIPKVYKIFGPGNQYVTAAKQKALQNGVAIDMPAGPSEVLVIADRSANPRFVAADLLSQAEHGVDSQVVLVSDSRDMLERVRQETFLQLEELPRKNIAEVALQYSRFIQFDNQESILNFVNEYGPEHLIINTRDTQFYSRGIQSAGSVFLGEYSPESAGDYASGTNHTLPTAGYAKQYGGVNLESFQKTISFQKITKEGLEGIGPAIETMAAAEGLEGHRNAVRLRLVPDD